MPEDADFVLKKTKNCHGFYGASSMEGLPTESALTEQTRKFKQIGRAQRKTRPIHSHTKNFPAKLKWPDWEISQNNILGII